jgi:hypothetical protein
VRHDPAPPPAALALQPDTVSVGGDPLIGLHEIDWAQLRHAHGSASDIPNHIRALASDGDDWADILDELLGDELLHQGSCYSATAPAIPFLARLATTSALPAGRRLELHR